MEAYRPIKTNHSVSYRSGSVDSGLGDKASLECWRKMCLSLWWGSSFRIRRALTFATVEPHSNCAVIRICRSAEVMSSTATVSRKLKLKVGNKTHRVLFRFYSFYFFSGVLMVLLNQKLQRQNTNFYLERLTPATCSLPSETPQKKLHILNCLHTLPFSAQVVWVCSCVCVFTSRNQYFNLSATTLARPYVFL